MNSLENLTFGNRGNISVPTMIDVHTRVSGLVPIIKILQDPFFMWLMQKQMSYVRRARLTGEQLHWKNWNHLVKLDG